MQRFKALLAATLFIALILFSNLDDKGKDEPGFQKTSKPQNEEKTISDTLYILAR